MGTNSVSKPESLNLPINKEICFSNHKKEFKEKIKKDQTKLLTKFAPLLKQLLEPGEEILLAVTATSPMSFLEQGTTGWMIYYLKRCVLVFTNKRILHFPTKSNYSPKHSLSQIRYGDIEKFKLSGFLGRVLKLEYKSGKKENFCHIKSREFRKLKTLQSLLAETHQASKAMERHSLCPKCTAPLLKNVFSCPNCHLEFKNVKDAIRYSIIFPGGGYFYAGHPFLGIMDAITEGILLIFLVTRMLEALKGVESWGSVLFIAIILFFEKSITIYHAKHSINEFIPADKNFLLASLHPAPEPYSPYEQTSKQSQKKWPKLAFAIILFVFSMSFLAWKLYPYLVNKDRAIEKEYKTTQTSQINLPGNRSYKERSPSIMEVAPKEIYQAFLYQYKLRPDTRFIKAFEILAERFGEFRRDPGGQSLYRLGEILSDEKEMIVPLIRENQSVAQIKVPLPIDFSGGVAALNEWLDVMEKGTATSETKPVREGSLERLEKADSEINKVDPRSIIFGLMELESLWRNVGPEPKIFRSAVKGYAMLLMVLHPDRMDYADSLAGYGLSFLALAKRLDPKLPLGHEEALLAMNMGYTAHATNLLQSGLEGLSDPVNRMLDAYMREDLQTLKTLQEKNPGVMSFYLLARLYRNIDLDKEAQEVSTEFFKRFPILYPAIVEMIYSGDLGLAKALTVLYPLDILARLEHVVSPFSFVDGKAWLARIKGFIGEPSTGNISITRFETLLTQWHPLEKEGEKGFIVDESRVKTIFKTLYTGALFLRFKMLKDRWAVVDMAQNYAQLLTAEDKDHPLVTEMLAEVYGEIGKRKEADALCAKVINHADTSGRLAGAAHSKVEDILNQIGLAAPAIQKMDGRPEYYFHRGNIFQRIHHYDLAEKFYSLGLAQNPYWYRGYNHLAQVTGSEAPLSSALTKFPYSFMLMEEAGDYFAGKEDASSKEKAVNYYETALKLVPTHESIPLRKAKVLRQLKRHDEAVPGLKDWIQKYGGKGGLTVTAYKSSLAKTYLEMGKPRLALEVVAEEVSTYQAGAMMIGARTYEELGELGKAGMIYHEVVNRYPTVEHVLSGTAGFFWRQGKHTEAAQIISHGRKSMGKFSDWYFKDFLEVFGQAPEDRIMEAVTLLNKYGATHWEICSLGFRFHDKKRPEVAYKILQGASTQHPMEDLERSVSIYKVLKKWKGEEEGLNYLLRAVPQQMRGPLTMVLFKEGLFELILIDLKDPKAYPQPYQEFCWLQRLIAWLALDQNPADLEKEFVSHYEESLWKKLTQKNSFDYYHTIGRYLLGMVSREELLGFVKTPKQRCEFTYYIGLSERLKSNFPDAANWYQICRETLLQNNGEFHWASDELFWWAHMGTKNRHRSLYKDIEEYQKRSQAS